MDGNVDDGGGAMVMREIISKGSIILSDRLAECARRRSVLNRNVRYEGGDEERGRAGERQHGGEK